MEFIVLALALAFWAATMLAAFRVVDRLRRTMEVAQIRHAQEREMLLDRVMYMADKPWMLPPQDQQTEEVLPYVDDALDEPIELMIDYDQIEPSARV